MTNATMFPTDWRYYLDFYSFNDSEEVYTNGSRLIPVFRVEQLIEHLLEKQETHDTRESRIFQCEKCGYGVEDIFLNSERTYPIIPVYCPNCGRKVVTDDSKADQ